MKDGEEIVDLDANFYRRVYRSDKRYIIKQTGRPTSRAFSPSPKDEGKLSVDLTSLTTPEVSVLDDNRFCLWEFSNVLIRGIDLRAIYNPILTEEQDGFNNPAHCLVIGIEEEDESKAGILARNARRVV